MNIATVEVIRPIYVPAGQTLDGVKLKAVKLADRGRHTLPLGYAKEQELAGYLEITDVDGVQAVWSACCACCDEPKE